MASPNNPDQGNFPNEEQSKTYPEWLNELECTCPAGAKIRPSSLPSATIDLGDIIADHGRILSTFASAYSMVTVILKMIACIIDVLCCLTGPICTLFAMIRLFGTCLPDFILLFPQLALPAIIICAVKILIAMVEYILTVIIPLIADIIQNIQDLIDAITDNNRDAQNAVAFKLAALIKEIYSVLGILAVLNALWVMIQSLIDAGVTIPCSGGGGSCSDCGDEEDICPKTLQSTTLEGTDGKMIVLYGNNGYSFDILFYSASKVNNLKEIRSFFPRGLDYSKIDEDEIPYKLNITNNNGSTNTYAMTSIASDGYATLTETAPTYFSDGYLTSTDTSGLPLVNPLDVRFTTKTETFTFNPSLVSRYITIQDLSSFSAASNNNGTYLIQSKYDSYNVILQRASGTWSTSGPTEHIRWYLNSSAPTQTSGLNFELEINHEELLRHNLIGVSCHPSLIATKEGLNNRFPDLNTTIPPLPDLNGLINNLDACMAKVAPTTVDSQYILDNYQTIANEIVNLQSCVTNGLNSFQTEVLDYTKNIYLPTFDQEADANFQANPTIQAVGQEIEIEVTPLDRNGVPLGTILPSGVINVSFETDFGTLSAIQEEIENGEPTGKYTVTLTSLKQGFANLKAKVEDRYVSEFNGSTLIPIILQVEFVIPTALRQEPETTEPLGK